MTDSELVFIEAGEKDGKRVVVTKKVVTKEEVSSLCCGTLEELLQRRAAEEVKLSSIQKQVDMAIENARREGAKATLEAEKNIAELTETINHLQK